MLIAAIVLIRLKKYIVEKGLTKIAIIAVWFAYPILAKSDLFFASSPRFFLEPNSAQEGTALWRKFYTSVESLPLDSVRGVPTLLKDFPTGCSSYAKRILNLVDEYGKIAALSNSFDWNHKDPKLVEAQISSILNVELGEKIPVSILYRRLMCLALWGS